MTESKTAGQGSLQALTNHTVKTMPQKIELELDAELLAKLEQHAVNLDMDIETLLVEILRNYA